MTDPVEVTSDGVHVRKEFDTDEFPVPTVTFDLYSEREESVTVRLVDHIPDSFSMDGVGFHPEYGSENWTAYPDRRVEFERELGPDERVRTVYGVQLPDDADTDAEAFAADPVVEAVSVDGLDAPDVDEDPVEETTMADIAPRERTDVVRDVISGERDGVPGMEESDATGTGDDPDAAVAEDGAAEEDPLARIEREAGSDDPDDPLIADADDAGDGDPLGFDDGDDAIAAAGSDGDGADTGDEGDPLGLADDETDDAAGSEDGTAAGEGGLDADDDEPVPDAADAEATGSDAADTDGEGDPTGAPSGAETDEGGALEPGEETGTDEVVAAADEAESPADEPTDGERADAAAAAGVATDDASGVAAALAAEIREGDVDDEDLATLEEAVGTAPRSTAVEVERLHARVGELEAYTEALEAFIDENGTATELLERVQSDLDAVESEVEAIDESVDGVESNLSEVRSEVEAAAADREDLRAEVETVAESVESVDEVVGDVERLQGDLEALDERLAGVEEDVSELDAVEADVETLQGDIEDLREWRDQLTNVFGGAGGTGDEN